MKKSFGEFLRDEANMTEEELSKAPFEDREYWQSLYRDYFPQGRSFDSRWEARGF